MARYPLLATCAALLLSGSSASALNSRQGLEQYVRRQWTSNEGLPQNTVHALLQSEDGYLWLGTQEGLVRFDGVSFRVYDRQNTPELRSSFIHALSLDRQGALWIGTGGGLTRYSAGSFRTYTTKEGLPQDIITALAVDGAGTLWIGTEAGLARLSGDTITPVTEEESVQGTSIHSLSVAADGTLWAATKRGASRWKDGRWAFYPHRAQAPSDVLWTILQDRAHRVWLGTSGGVLLRLEQERLVPYAQGAVPRGARITALWEDRDDNLWLGTSHGLYRLTHEHGRLESAASAGLPSDPVLSLFEDKEGSLWAGSENGGVMQLRSGKLSVFTASRGLPHNNVWTIHQAPGGAMWIGTSGGVARIEGDRVATTWPVRFASDEVTSVYAASDGAVWIGTMFHGVERIGGPRAQTASLFKRLAYVGIHSLREDRQGRMWIGTSGEGLYGFDRGAVTHHGAAEGLADDVVWAIQESRDGSLWVGTRGGLSRLRDGQLVSDAATRALAEHSVMSIHEDREGALWLGTYGKGLHLIRGDRHFAFKQHHGLFNEIVFHILEDDAGNLWMSCNKGLFRIDKEALLAVADGRMQRLTSIVYGQGEGMRVAEGNGSRQPGAWKASDGRLWFPTIAGAVVIDPREAGTVVNPVPPDVHIEEVWADGSRVEASALARIPPGQGRLEFRYVGVSFTSPELVAFKYRLEGFDTEWIDAGNTRSARYANIPPGKYRFQVKAANSDGVWSQDAAAVALLIEPHYYQTWWFRALLGGLALATAWGLHRVITQQMRTHAAVLAERNRLAREIHDGLTQTLTGVLIQLEAAVSYLPDAPHLTREHLDRARTWARHSLSDARRMVWALRPSVTSVSALASGLERCAAVLTKEGDIRVEVRTEQDLPLAPELGVTLLRIGQEAITNAVRHGRPHHLQIKVRMEGGALELQLSDDGRGFEEGHPSTSGGGLGLVSMRERAEGLGGRLTIDSKPGQGTRVTAIVPLQREAPLGGDHG